MDQNPANNYNLLLCIIIILAISWAFHSLPLPASSSSDIVQLASGRAAGFSTSSSSPIFIFGASMVDAGENAVAMPHRSNAECSPYGSDYFGKPVGRWSNGRNFMDFITEALGYGHIPPYLQSVGSDFSYGVNFASAGSTAANSSAVGSNSGGLFCLLVQIDQFRDFHDEVLSSYRGLEQKVSVIREQFSDAIYFFETGNNDYMKAVDEEGASFDLNTTVTATIAAMKTAFQAMYALGARTFIIMNVTPLGCSPAVLNKDDGEEVDENNCNVGWMNIVRVHNERLDELLDELREDYSAAEWVLFDAHSIFLDGYRNPSNYGILYPFQACCGAGGTYNVNTNVQCGMEAQNINGTLVEWTKCENPKQHLIWDSIHPVESFAFYIAQGVVNGTHLSPSFSLKDRVLRRLGLSTNWTESS